MSRLVVYIDGFNFYYGAVKGTPYKWLDFEKLVHILFPKDELIMIRYFTARVRNNPLSPGQRERQARYLRALETIPKLAIHEGYFLSRIVSMPMAPPATGYAQVVRFEEKGSDVNLATYLIIDAVEDQYDVAAVISHDGDLALPIRMANERLRKTVGVIGYDARLQIKYGKIPRGNRKLKEVAAFYKTIRESALKRSLFPDTVQSSAGPILKPDEW